MPQGHRGHGRHRHRRRSRARPSELTGAQSSLAARLLTPLSFLAFVLIHLTFASYVRFTALWRRVRTWRRSLEYTEEDLVQLARSGVNLPKHIAITLHARSSSHFDMVNRKRALRAFVQLAGLVGVADVSIWDEDGLWQEDSVDTAYKDESERSSPSIHILTPATHGRQAFASLSKCIDGPISPAKLDAKLRRSQGSCSSPSLFSLAATEPDLLLVLGGHWTSRLSLGSQYPRWDLRLTELFHRTEDEYRPGRSKELSIFAEALLQFQKAEQRYGK